MNKPQVRLDEDVAAALARAAERTGTSVAVEANKALRRALGLQAQAATRKPTITGTLRGAPSLAATARASRGTLGGCPHPLNRRIGGRCAVCGATVTTR